MAKRRLLLGSLALGGALLAAGALSAGAGAQAPRALRLSRNLWATIDVCNAPHERNTIGIRGSMPGDGRAGDAMYMRFRLQMMDSAANQWLDLPDASSDYFAVGNARSARQAGRSFVLVPPRGHAVMLRGVVSFQWRRGSSIVAALSRPTTAGHESVAGADPPNYSAATCQIG